MPAAQEISRRDLLRLIVSAGAAVTLTAPGLRKLNRIPNSTLDTAPYNVKETLDRIRRRPEISYSLCPDPPMGFNTWSAFGGNISLELCLKQMQLLHDSGLQEAGYKNFTVDDGLAANSRNFDSSYRTVPDNAIPILAKAAQNLDQNLWWYTSVGDMTCEGKIGSRGFEWNDMREIAPFIKGIKLDKCYPNSDILLVYENLRNSIDVFNSNMIIEICDKAEDATHTNWEWRFANVRRVTQDIKPTWQSIKDNFINSLPFLTEMSWGHWNDLDMVLAGNDELNKEEQESQVLLWTSVRSPLNIGVDISKIKPNSDVFKLLTNPALLKLHKDKTALTETGNKIDLKDAKDGLDVGTYQITQPIEGGIIAATLFNSNDRPTKMTIPYDEKKWHGKLVVVHDIMGRIPDAVIGRNSPIVIQPRSTLVLSLTAA